MAQSPADKSLEWIRGIHWTRITKGPRDSSLVFCTNDDCGFLGAHETYEDAVTDLQWHRAETSNG